MDGDAHFDLAGTPVEIRPGDDVLRAAARAGRSPGGVLCATGDCPNCLATVDDTAYVRMCQTPAAAGLRVTPFGPAEVPPFEVGSRHEPSPIHHRHADAVVIGLGATGTAALERFAAAGIEAIGLDATHGEEVVGIYAGPTVVARTPGAIVHVHCEQVVVATGTAALQPICPGSSLRGLLTPEAFAAFAAHGVDLGVVAHVGTDVRSFESDDGVNVARVRTVDGAIDCDTAVVDIGRTPRDALLRMSADLEVHGVGSVLEAGDEPALPAEGVACPCKQVTVPDLESVWSRGFTHLELLKRGSGAGTGTCQGSVCLPYLRSFVAEKQRNVPDPFTARPLTRQLTMAEAAAGQHLPALARTALDAEHRALGAHMDRFGGWWRPWTYGDTDAEYEAVRERVSIGDVSTLGKMTVRGPDAEALLQRLYPTDISTIRRGRSRYVLMLDERGYVFDDGMVARVDDHEFLLTFTSGGASHAEMWVRDQAFGFDVRLMNTTMSQGAINVSGPMARNLLETLGLDEDLAFLGFGTRTIAGVECTAFRLSFTGELSYELHHARGDSVRLWTALLDAGQPHGILPHGLEALMRLRLEKGHIVVGQDTDYDSTPRRLDHGWAVNLDSGEFVGRQATLRTDRLALDKRLVGLTAGQVPHEGASLWDGDRFAGHVTSAAWSPVTESAVMLAWLRLDQGADPDHIEVETFEGRIPARLATLPFYDPKGEAPRG